MTASAPDSSLRSLLASQHEALRRAVILKHALPAAAWIAGAIAIAVALGVAFPPTPAGATLRLVVLALAAVVATGRAAWRAARETPTLAQYLERVEQALPETRSLLRNALELEADPSAHTSNQLASALRAEAARRASSAPIAALRPKLAAARPLGAIAFATAALAALTFVAPGAMRHSWSTLLDPSSAAPPVALSVTPGSVRIPPGSALSIRARVQGSDRAPLLLRSGAHAPRAVDEGAAEGVHVWRFDLPPVTREEDYGVRVANVASPRYHVALIGDPSPVSFTFELRAPAYARLPVQSGRATTGDLSALRGTRATVEVTFDRDVTQLGATLPGGMPARFDALTPRRWRGVVPIEHDGEYALDATAPSGRSIHKYAIHAQGDAPPVIAVRLPEGDQDLPVGQQIGLEVLGEDDLGLSTLELEFHKDAAAPWQHVPLVSFHGQPREAHLASHWDASALGLLPGESATFRFALYDNNAFGRGVARSATFAVRFPSLAELYRNVGDRQQSAQTALEKAAEQSRELQKKLDQLARQSAANPSASPFERREEMKGALDRQQDLSKKLDQAAEDLHTSLEHAAERQAFNQELQRRLKEMSELVSQIQSNEFKDALKKIQEAMQNLSRGAMEQNLPDWRKQNQEMLSNLERSIELLKKLRQEEQLDALAHRADELKRAQDELNREHAGQKPDAESKSAQDSKKSDAADSSGDAKSGDKSGEQKAAENQSPAGGDSSKAGSSPASQAEQQKRDALAQKQEHAAEQSHELSEDVKKNAETDEEKKAALQEAAKELQNGASQEQSQAAGSARKGQSKSAHSQGQAASKSLQSAQQMLQNMVQQMEQQRQSVDLAAVRRGAQDLLSLERESEGPEPGTRPGDSRSDRQTDVSDGVARVADSLSALSKRTPFITQRLGEALGQAMVKLSGSGRAFGEGNAQQGDALGREGSQALNTAVLELRKTESSMCKSPNRSGQGGQSAGEQMSQLGQQQGQLNRESQQITRRLSQQMRMSAGDQAQMRRLAEQQRRIREQLEQMARDEDKDHKLLGRLDATRRDMKEVEETLEQGATDPELEQKEQHILSRLLDAARSVNRRDYDPARESHVGDDVARRTPGEIPTDLLRETDRLRSDLLKAESDRYPAQYRAFIEAYLRALNGSKR